MTTVRAKVLKAWAVVEWEGFVEDLGRVELVWRDYQRPWVLRDEKIKACSLRMVMNTERNGRLFGECRNRRRSNTWMFISFHRW